MTQWAFKFVWAPFVNRCGTARWGFRSCIIVSQLAMVFALLPLLWLDPDTQFSWWKLFLLVHAFAAATQGVAIDALAINSVPQEELGRLNGCMQAGMLVGRSLFWGDGIGRCGSIRLELDHCVADRMYLAPTGAPARDERSTAPNPAESRVSSVPVEVHRSVSEPPDMVGPGIWIAGRRRL